MSYAGNGHWEWIRNATKQEPSELGKAVANVLGYVGRGIYNAPINPGKVNWTDPYCISVTWSHHDMANWDFPQLTMLVVECHRRMLRVSISGCAPRRLRLMFWQRNSRVGSTSERLPDIEEMVAAIDKEHGREAPPK